MAKRIDVYSAGCPLCMDTIDMVKRLAEGDEVHIRDMQQREIADAAQRLGIRSVPAVVIDGQLADCCRGRGPDEDVIRRALRKSNAPLARERDLTP
jgi:glutaredoxin